MAGTLKLTTTQSEHGEKNVDETQFEKLQPGYLLGEHEEFRLVKMLGKGGMGVTWLAEELDSSGKKKQSVVCKILSQELINDENAIGNVLEVFDLTKNLHDTNICPLLDWFQDPVFKEFLVMRYAEGERLDVWFEKLPGHENGLAPATVLPILEQIAAALDAMHLRKIIHRDVKPQNIIFSTQDPKLAKPWLIDFGIAQAVNDSDPDHNKQKSGTPIFMAPEQHYGKPQDARTDQYALAVTAFWLLTGHFPFVADTAEELSANKKFPQYSLTPVSESLKSTFLRALAYEPKDRFTSCGEFVKALKSQPTQPSSPFQMPSADSDSEKTLDEFREAIREAISQRTELLKDYLPESARIATQDSEVTRRCAAYLRKLESEIADFDQKISQMRADGMREDGPAFRAVIQQHQEHADMKLDFSSEVPPKTPKEWEMLLHWKEECKRREEERKERERKEIERIQREQIKQKWASIPKDLKAGMRFVLECDGIEYVFRWCPPGSFLMGSPEDEPGRYDDETQHSVTLTQGFWMLETQVTQAMWQSVMGTSSRQQRDKRNTFWSLRGEGSDYPMYFVSWEECRSFCEKLSEKLGLTVSLPTEAQWEYACRAGTTSAYSFGSSLNGREANCDGNYPYGTSTKGPYLEKTVPVKSYAPNAWGLYDMHGNVWEWCQDWYDEDYYAESPTSDPTGPSSGSDRVNRGGSWDGYAQSCRSAYRDGDTPDVRDGDLGFRPVLASPVPEE